ncbi:MAG TPA: TonB-dependent receptor [Woeseiaceae bacterium]|nr:TonB-dependent receptor [Woeseiaceae bacterium]
MHSSKPRRFLAPVLGLGLSLTAGMPAVAQDTELEEIVVTGQVPMRNRTEAVAPELTYGLDFFQQLEPISVGDMLKRVPGVAFTSDVGERESPQLRGMGFGFTQVLINGKPVPDAGGESATERSVLVDRIPAELVDRVEIIRSPSADIDSQGIGGTINIILKNGATLPPGGSVRGSILHYVEDTRGGNFGAGGFSYAGRSDDERLAWSVTANVQERFNPKLTIQEVFTSDRGTLDDALRLFAKNGADSVITDGEERSVESDVRENLDKSFHGDLDFRISDRTSLALTGYWIDTDRTERQDTLIWEDSPDNLVALESEDTEFDQENWGVALDLTHHWTDAVTVSGGIAYGRFDNDIFTLNSEIDAEDVAGPLPTEASFLDDPTVAPFGLEPDSVETIASFDEEFQANADIEFHVPGFAAAIGADDGSFKLGVQSKFKSRDVTQVEAEFDDGVLTDPEPTDNGGEFSIEEDRIDVFALLDLSLTDRLTLETGLRFEHTSTDLTGLVAGVRSTRSVSESDLNPSVHLRWEFHDRATLRASYARTVRRPDFNQRIPFAQFDSPDDDDVTRGNPDLDIETSDGVDLGVEFELPDRGIAGINVFYRDIKDLIQLVRGPENDDGGSDYTFMNVGDGEVWGYEFDLSTPLSMFGLEETGFYANYTRLYSEKTDVFSGLSDVRIDRQPVFVYNVGLTQAIPAWRMSMGASFQKQGRFYQYLLDEIETGVQDGNLEIFIEKRFFNDRLVARLTGSNLLDDRTLQAEQNFDGPISDGELDEFEIEHEESTPFYQLTLRYNF